ncbi:MAG: hypothetical protein WBD36_02365 [Bacteroidota bacterium]
MKQLSDISEKLIAQLGELNLEAMKAILTYGEMSLSESQFRAFRRKVLDLYGRNGLQAKVKEVVKVSLGLGTDRAGAPLENGQDKGKGVVTMT